MSKGLIGGMFAMAMGMATSMTMNAEAKKEELLKEWIKSQQYPRKLKKETRKRLLLNYGLVRYQLDIFKPLKGLI